MSQKSWPSEQREHCDPVSGQTVRQLTDYKGHSHHLYFTNPGWHDSGKRLLFGSDRDNRTNLFSLELTTGGITQLTDFTTTREEPFNVLFSCVNPLREEAYFWHERELRALDLATSQQRVIYEVPAGFETNMLNCTADGRHVCTGIYEDLSDRFPVDLLHGYVGFAEYWAAHPLSRVVRVAVDGSGSDILWEERSWIGHVNTSPKHPHLLSFCHEGPWEKVDQRIWGLDANSGRVWKIRSTTPGERIGHEYWLADGETLGYHGHIGGRNVFGFVRYDDSERMELPMATDSQHFFSNDRELIVGDGANLPYVLLWRRQGDRLDGPRILCQHRSSRHMQQTHVHPRFTPDGRRVVYTSDASGYGNVYEVAVPDFEALPRPESLVR